MAREKIVSMVDAAGLIRPGMSLAVGGTTFSRKPMEFIRSLVRQGARELELYGFLASMDVDLLVGAGCVRATHCSYVGFEYLGMAPNFRRKAENNEISVTEHTEATIINGLRASAMGLPFLPANASFGSQIIDRLGLKIINCPYTGQQVLACKAIRPDFAVIHALRSDAYGNVQAPAVLDFLADTDYVMARASGKVIVTVEEVVSNDEVRKCPERTVLFEYEVDAVVEAPRGAYPTGFFPLYQPDMKHMKSYSDSARSGGAFKEYLRKHVYNGSA